MNTQPITKQSAIDFYLEYVNNFLTIERDCRYLVNLGKQYHQDKKVVIRMEKHGANYPNGKFLCYTFEANTFEDGFRMAEEKYRSAGLIGRIYIKSSDGNNGWINKD